MSSPQPPVPLQNECSAIIGNTLYVYSPTAFLSLPLKVNATWSTLPNGVPVTGAKCVQGLDDGPGSGDALWVVGGKANATETDYPGLQKFSFSNQSWTSIEPLVKVTQNRQNHGAAFMNSTGQILVYAGSQDDPQTPSIETFLIDTTAPYNVQSFTSLNAPVLAPVLLPWDDSSAISLGGNTDTQVYRFIVDAGTHQGGWHEYPTQLSSPLKDSQNQQAVLISGTDNSKVLEMFDMSVQPAEATTLVLQDANGQPAQTGETLAGGGSGSSKRLLKRDLTLANWPPYNSTAAPSYTRDGFSVAQGSSGIVAMVGGNDQHAVSLFDDSQNAWVDTSQFFGTKDNNVNAQSVLAPSPTSAKPTQAPTSTSTPPTIPGAPSHHKTSVILGAVLGSILGLIAILVAILIFFYFRNKKKQRQQAQAAAEDEKRRMSFADRGAPFMMEGGHPTEKQIAHGSIALMGNSVNHGRPATGNSDNSTTKLIPRKAPGGPLENHEMSPIGEMGTDTSSHIEGNRTLPLASDSSRGDSGYLNTPKRTSGWSRYFSGNNAAGLGAGAAAGAAAATGYRKGGGRQSADTYSNYTADSSHDCSTHGPTEIPPLRMGERFENDRISRVVTGSPPSSPPTTSYDGRGSSSRPRTLNSETSERPSTIDENLFGKPFNNETSWSPVENNANNYSQGLTGVGAVGAKMRDPTPSSIYSHTPRNSEQYAKGLQPIYETNSRQPQTARISNATSAQSQYSDHPLPNAARASDPDTWPRPPSNGLTIRTNSVKTMGSVRTADSPPPLPRSFNDDLEPPQEFEEEAPATPTAITAIPVPASTAMQYTVRKPSPKPVTNSDMSWVNLNG